MEEDARTKRARAREKNLVKDDGAEDKSLKTKTPPSKRYPTHSNTTYFVGDVMVSEIECLGEPIKTRVSLITMLTQKPWDHVRSHHTLVNHFKLLREIRGAHFRL